MPYSSTKGRFLEKCPKSDKVRNKLYSELSNAIHNISKQSEEMVLDKKVLDNLTLSMRHPISVSQSSDSMR